MTEPLFSIQFKRPGESSKMPLYAILPLSTGYAELCVPQDVEALDALLGCLQALKPMIVRKPPAEDFAI